MCKKGKKALVFGLCKGKLFFFSNKPTTTKKKTQTKIDYVGFNRLWIHINGYKINKNPNPFSCNGEKLERKKKGLSEKLQLWLSLAPCSSFPISAFINKVGLTVNYCFVFLNFQKLMILGKWANFSLCYLFPCHLLVSVILGFLVRLCALLNFHCCLQTTITSSDLSQFSWKVIYPLTFYPTFSKVGALQYPKFLKNLNGPSIFWNVVIYSPFIFSTYQFWTLHLL